MKKLKVRYRIPNKILRTVKNMIIGPAFMFTGIYFLYYNSFLHRTIEALFEDGLFSLTIGALLIVTGFLIFTRSNIPQQKHNPSPVPEPALQPTNLKNTSPKKSVKKLSKKSHVSPKKQRFAQELVKTFGL